jgi:hypothetical protein
MSNNNGKAGPGAKQAAPKGLELELTLLQGGVNKDLTPAGMSLRGQMITQAALDGELTADLALYAAVDQARAKLKTALAALTAAVPAMKARVELIRQAVICLLGADNPQLADFGIAVKKPRRPLTSEENALAVARRAATRAARRTVGPVEKLKTVGATPTVTIGPEGTTVAYATPPSPTPAVARAAPASMGSASGPVQAPDG